MSFTTYTFFKLFEFRIFGSFITDTVFALLKSFGMGFCLVLHGE